MPAFPPAGYSPASAYDLVGLAESQDPVPILADMIDPDTGDFASIEDSATIADGLVVTLLRTTRGSGASVLEFGQRFREVRHMTADAPVLAESLAREALQPAIDAGVLEFRQLEATPNDRDATQLDTDLKYLDLLSPRQDATLRLTFTP